MRRQGRLGRGDEYPKERQRKVGDEDDDTAEENDNTDGEEAEANKPKIQ